MSTVEAVSLRVSVVCAFPICAVGGQLLRWEMHLDQVFKTADREIAHDVKEKPHYFDFRCEEVLLQPSLTNQYDVDIRKNLCTSVVLSGGTTETFSLLAPNEGDCP